MLWLLEWLITSVNMVFYLFKQRFTSMFCRLLQAYINNIVSFNLFKHTYKSKNVIVLSNNQYYCLKFLKWIITQLENVPDI